MTEITLKIKSISVLQRKNYSDSVSIETVLPAAVWPFNETEPLFLDFKAAGEGGVEYVRKHFGIEPKLIKLD